MDTQITVVLLIVFVGLSAFFSSSETAFFALQQVRVHHLVESNVPRAKRVARMKANPERFLSTVLLGNNLVNVALTALATSLAISLIGDDQRGMSVAVAIAAATMGIVIFGEAIPKTVAARHPERMFFAFLAPLELLEKVLFPLATVLRWVSTSLIRPVIRPGTAVPVVSEEELKTLVRVGVGQGSVEETEAEIIQKAFRFGDLQAQAIMTPRTEIVFMSRESTFQEFLATYGGETHTRFPVYEGEPDNVVGTLSVKDVLKEFSEGKLGQESPIGHLMRPMYFHPETKPVDDLFVEMRGQGTQMVLLIDEFGGIAGLLTVKQIVGEIMGDIIDQEGDEEPEVETIDEKNVQVDASMRLEEANERLAMALPAGEYETLAGYMLSELGHIPKVGEQVRHDGLRLVVTEMRGVKIERILVTRS